MRGGDRGNGKEEGEKNVAGMGNKDEKFRKGLRRWNIILMVETWIEMDEKRLEESCQEVLCGRYNVR